MKLVTLRKAAIAFGLGIFSLLTMCGILMTLSNLSRAIAKGDIERMKKSIAAGKDVDGQDQYGCTMLTSAMLYGWKNKSIMTDPIKREQRTVRIAQMVKILLDAGANPNKTDDYSNTPLINAIKYAGIDVVEVLIKNGADVNLRAGFGEQAPLHCAVRQEDPNIVKLLLQNGADPNIKDSDGKTPLKLAQEFEMPEIISILQSDYEN